MPSNQVVEDRAVANPEPAQTEVKHYDGPAGGWGSLRGIASIFGEEWPTPGALETLARQNKPDGFMCVSCSWAKPAEPASLRILRERRQGDDLGTDQHAARRNCSPQHTVKELLTWKDHDLEQAGPAYPSVRYDRAERPLRAERAGTRLLPRSAPSSSARSQTDVFYASGQASLETSYLYALFARMYGNNNLPDSSNMCHETTSVA